MQRQNQRPHKWSCIFGVAGGLLVSMEHARREQESDIRELGPARPAVHDVLGPQRVLALQRTAGNRAVTAMLARQGLPSTAAPPAVTQALYDQAVALLASRNANMHQ